MTPMEPGADQEQELGQEQEHEDPIETPAARIVYRQIKVSVREASRLYDRIYQDFLGARSDHDNRIAKFRTVLWLSGVSAYDNVLAYMGTPLFSNTSHPGPVTIATQPGDEILFSLLPGDGRELYSGPDSRNADATPHFLVVATPPRMPNPVPEPAGWGLLATVMLFVGARIGKQRGKHRNLRKVWYCIS